jgi:phosphatidylglycerophosphatase C
LSGIPWARHHSRISNASGAQACSGSLAPAVPFLAARVALAQSCPVGRGVRWAVAAARSGNAAQLLPGEASRLLVVDGHGGGQPGVGDGRVAAAGVLPARYRYHAGGRQQSWAPDAVVVVAGVNDLTRLRPGPAWRRDVAGLVAAIRLRLGGRPTVLLAGLPPIHRFPALPWTVRWPLGAHARWLDHQLARLAGEEPDCHHLPVRRLPVEPTRFFAADRFHPSPVGYRVWSQALASQAAALLAPAAPAGAPVVLFDFDGVLIRGDSYAHLVRRELQRSWWRRLAMLPVLAAAMPMLKVPALRRSGQRLVVRLAFVGYSTAQFNGRAAEFGRHLARDQQVVVGDAVAAARRHLSSGARVVVVTASAQPLVRAVLDELGLSSVELIASQPACGRLGLRAPLRNHGAEKLRQLAAHRLQPPWQIAYSDSASDLPMLHGAVRPILVNPDARLLAHARREFGQRISSVQWC